MKNTSNTTRRLNDATASNATSALNCVSPPPPPPANSGLTRLARPFFLAATTMFASSATVLVADNYIWRGNSGTSWVTSGTAWDIEGGASGV
ncbi:MAG: hypothetical protein LBD14_01245, partial [Puniceicoccales bacterium]|nr:hypothetical protein [Puniceicoccales bacterium]